MKDDYLLDESDQSLARQKIALGQGGVPSNSIHKQRVKDLLKGLKRKDALSNFVKNVPDYDRADLMAEARYGAETLKGLEAGKL